MTAIGTSRHSPRRNMYGRYWTRSGHRPTIAHQPRFLSTRPSQLGWPGCAFRAFSREMSSPSSGDSLLTRILWRPASSLLQLRRATLYSSQAIMLQCAGNALFERPARRQSGFRSNVDYSGRSWRYLARVNSSLCSRVGVCCQNAIGTFAAARIMMGGREPRRRGLHWARRLVRSLNKAFINRSLCPLHHRAMRTIAE
jgi:hypothetical protein